MEFKDYYKILGVSRQANAEEIRKAFRKLARQFHPDVARNKAVAEEKFKEINEAYEVLGDPEKRQRYDTLGADWKQSAGFAPPPGWDRRRRRSPGRRGPEADEFEFHFGGTGFSDFFEQFFGKQSREARGSAPAPEFDSETTGTTPQRGQDIEGDVLVTLAEVVSGSVRSITVRRVNSRTGETETLNFRVRIPAGVHDGQRIRVAGKGEEGLAGGRAGDLFLRVRLAQHPDFRVRGADLFYELELAPWEAVLGAQLRIPTLDGSVTLRIPPGTNSGQQLRVRGHGLPVAGGDPGDLYVVASLQIPTQLTSREKELWEQLAHSSSFNPRK